MIVERKEVKSYFAIMTKHNRLQLEKLLEVCAPNIKYSEDEILHWVNDDSRSLNQFISVSDLNVGGIVTKCDDSCVYIQAIVILPHFRECGLGSRLVQEILKKSREDKQNFGKVCVTIPNRYADSVAWFQKLNFVVSEKGEDDTQMVFEIL